MPFRQNMFNEKIAQPGTSLVEIENQLFFRYGGDEVKLENADLFTNGDDNFKFGGTLHFTIETTVEIDEDDDIDGTETYYEDATMEFDGFETIEAARQFLADLGLVETQIYEVA